MGGLWRFLPVTAVASVLASLSMAGLPPFLGFISKEFLFEAQIQSSWDALPMAVAVLVNAVMVGVAGVVTLRPFFMGARRVRDVRHREVPGSSSAPMLLGLLGLVISLEPTWVEPSGVAAGGGSHLRPAGGGESRAVARRDANAPAQRRRRRHRRAALRLLGAHPPATAHSYGLDRYDVEHAYDALLRRIRATARGVAGACSRATCVTTSGSSSLPRRRSWSGGSSRRAAGRDCRPIWVRCASGPAALALVGLAGGLAATRARSLLAAMIATGLTGLVAALTFLMNGAPDLALTQFAVESLVVVLLTAALLVLPLAAPTTRSRGARGRDAAVATVLSVLLFVALLDMSAAPQNTDVSAFFGARSYLEAFGRNVVNVILVDFRGFDTLGETTVIALSAVIAWSLLGPRAPLEERSAGARRSVFVLAFASPLFFWLLAVLSVIVLLRGHNEIGGGFVGGLTAALAFAIVALTHGVDRARVTLRFHPLTLVGGGLLLAVASGLPGLVVYGDYLRHIWVELTVFGVHVKQGTTLLFDLGVYLAVLGTVLAFLFGLTREAES